MTVKEILEQAFEANLFSDKVHGATPQKTLHARLSSDIVKNGERSKFARTGRGVFVLREFFEQEGSSTQGGTADNFTPYTAMPRRPSNIEETVLAFPRDQFLKICNFQGIRYDDGTLLRSIIEACEPIYLPRSAAEMDQTIKQVITYVMVTRSDAVLGFKRGVFNRAASFLRGNQCIGFGGHVNINDMSLFSYSNLGITECAFRELHEEVFIEPIFEGDISRLKIIGILNDDSSPVGQQHFAVVYSYDVDGHNSWIYPRRRELSINQLGWIETSSHININKFEYWSQLCWQAFYQDISQTQPHFNIIRTKRFEGRHILSVIGTIGSGKSVAVTALREKWGYSTINTGQTLARILGIPPVPETPREQFQKKAWEFINSPNGPQELAKAILDEINSTPYSNVAIDGLRQKSTINALKDAVSVNFAMLFVHAAPHVAFDFYQSREGGSGQTADRFMELYTNPVEQEVSLLISEADAVLYNWTGKLGYDRAIDDLMAAIQSKRKKP